MTAAIQIENLHKTYGQVRAVDGLSLSVAPGTIFGFLGPNGAGKSTTLRMLTGLATPTGGQAWIAGLPISDRQGVARKIGYLPEEPAFYTWMTPIEFLDHVGRVFGLPPAERAARVKTLLEQVDLASARKRRIAGFSRGMRQRLGLAQALINRPDVLLLDEPVSALDPAGRKEVLDMIVALKGSTSVLMSTHILADVERVCDTVGIINHGRLVTEAAQDELLARYTIPAFELEVEPFAATAFDAWMQTLAGEAWVSSVVRHNGHHARVVVSDVAVARQALLEQAAQAHLALRRYEIVTPSLEDVFLKLVGQEEKR